MSARQTPLPASLSSLVSVVTSLVTSLVKCDVTGDVIGLVADFGIADCRMKCDPRLVFSSCDRLQTAEYICQQTSATYHRRGSTPVWARHRRTTYNCTHACPVFRATFKYYAIKLLSVDDRGRSDCVTSYRAHSRWTASLPLTSVVPRRTPCRVRSQLMTPRRKLATTAINQYP